MGSQNLPLNDKDSPYKPETRNRRESIRSSDEAIVAMKEEDNITPSERRASGDRSKES